MAEKARKRRSWLKPPIAAPTQPKNRKDRIRNFSLSQIDNGSRNSGQQASDDEDQRHAGNSNANDAARKYSKGKTPRGATRENAITSAGVDRQRLPPRIRPASLRSHEQVTGRHARLDGSPHKIASNALRSVSCRNTNPLLSALFGSTRWPPSKSSLAKSPPTRRSSASGMRKIAGRCSRRPSSSVNFRLVTGIGAVALTGPGDFRTAR